jgi:hypothetical protein
MSFELLPSIGEPDDYPIDPYAPPDYELWMNPPPNPDDKLTEPTHDGTMVSSRAEVLIYNCLDTAGFKFWYNIALTCNGLIETRPDFVIRSPRDGRYWVWEHMGMRNVARSLEKIEIYNRAGMTDPPTDDRYGPLTISVPRPEFDDVPPWEKFCGAHAQLIVAGYTSVERLTDFVLQRFGNPKRASDAA